MRQREYGKGNENRNEEMGIRSSLTPSRANGFLNMVKRVKDEAAILSGRQ